MYNINYINNNNNNNNNFANSILEKCTQVGLLFEKICNSYILYLLLKLKSKTKNVR